MADRVYNVLLVQGWAFGWDGSEPADTNMSRDPTPPGSAPRPVERYRRNMESARPESLLGLLMVVATSLVVLVYAFLRMAGVLGHPHREHRRRGLH